VHNTLEIKKRAGELKYYLAADNVRDFISNWGGKLKDKADVFVNKLKDEWSQ